jgi:hypothetical protein
MISVDKGAWVDEIYNSVGKFMTLETLDGINREGRLSGLRLRNIILNGEPVDVIIELEVNGDPTDCIPMDRIAKMSFQR